MYCCLAAGLDAFVCVCLFVALLSLNSVLFVCMFVCLFGVELICLCVCLLACLFVSLVVCAAWLVYHVACLLA